MTQEEKKTITREKHPERVAHDHKLAALMKKGKEEILRNKEQSSVQSTEQSLVHSTGQSLVQPTEQPSVQSTVQANDTYIYGVGRVSALAIGVCVFFAYNTFQPKKQANEKPNQPPKGHHMLQILYNK